MSRAQSCCTIGSSSFDPHTFFEHWNDELLPQDGDLRAAIVKAFELSPADDYVYHATASVTLGQVQDAIAHGGANGLHAWYRDEDGSQKPPPPAADIIAYTQIFSPMTSTVRALTSFGSNAKKGSIRESVAQHLLSQLVLPPASTGLSLPNRQKKPVENPYFDLWSWSCHNLEWTGPTSDTAEIKHSHHILPVFYHHLGCVCPSFDAISLVQQLACRKQIRGHQRPVVEIGSGNGYWAYMLRRHGVTVHCVDNLASAWRTMWISDTIITDGIEFLKKPPLQLKAELGPGAENALLLLVYPRVSADFTGRVLRSYKGDTIIVAGTQNSNGFTGFLTETISSWMARERPQFKKVAQIPLPSFAGKDEALYIFGRKDTVQ